MEAIYRFHPMFASEEFPVWLGGSDQDWGRCHVEGGDVQPIGNGTVMIGMGERTTPQAVLWIARSLFRAGKLSKANQYRGSEKLVVESALSQFPADTAIPMPAPAVSVNVAAAATAARRTKRRRGGDEGRLGGAGDDD